MRVGIDQQRAARGIEAALAARDLELRRIHPHAGEGDDPLRAVTDVGTHHRIAAEEVAHAAVEQLLGPRDHAALDPESAVPARHQIGVGGQVDDADTLDAVVVDPPLEPAGVAACAHIRDDDRGGVDIVGADAQVVRQDRRHLDGDVAVDPRMVGEPANRRVQPDDPPRPRVYRQQDPRCLDARQTLGIQVLDPRRAEPDRARPQLIVHRRRRERAVEDEAAEHVTSRQVGRDRPGRQQLRIDREIAEPAVGEIDDAARVDGQRTGAELYPRVGLALVEGRVDRHVEPRRGQPLDRAFEVEAGPGEAAHHDVAVGGGDAQVRKLPPAQRHQRAALPARPASLAADGQRQRRLERGHGRDDAAGRRGQLDV